jgi:hypothetical protein
MPNYTTAGGIGQVFKLIKIQTEDTKDKMRFQKIPNIIMPLIYSYLLSL